MRVGIRIIYWVLGGSSRIPSRHARGGRFMPMQKDGRREKDFSYLGLPHGQTYNHKISEATGD